MFFNGWEGILRTVIVGALAYVCLVLLLRISGKRTLSKMNAFDFVVTVAFGSTLASILLSKDVSLAQGVTAMALLILLQYIVAWTSVRSKWFSELVKSQPVLLLYKGQFLKAALIRERVAQEEVLAAIRSQGISEVGAALAVVLETDGTFTVVQRDSSARASSLSDVSGLPLSDYRSNGH
ncbi:MAG: YetF domain-containing protein [Chloroflexota bacterium]